ncbi:MAG: SurA N-terminal domain-containing protein, partial [Deltaproteobacteria bacterium]|nr:SurA N-terminal domain-containing protein [Deltaproteobacteria bacterium]
MLQLMRKHAKNWLMKAVLGIIIVVFVFYFGSTRGTQETETIAMIDGARIVQADFRNEYQNLLELYRQQYGEHLTDDLIKQIGVKQQAFDSILGQAIIMSKADELKLDVSDEELQAFIFSHPAFQRNGVFSSDLYQRALRYQRMTPEIFEAIQRRALRLEKMERLIRESAKASEREVYEIHKLQNRKVNVDFIRVPVETGTVKGKPSAEVLEAYLKEHGEDFRIPQMATIEYIVFEGESFATADISDDEIQDYYDYTDDFKDNGKTKPLSTVRGEIVSRLKSIKGMDAAHAEATEAHDTIYQEENFEAYAKERGLTIETAELFRNVPPAGRFAGIQGLGGYVFGLEEGDLGHVVSDDTGYYLFRLVSLKPSRIPGLQEVRDRVRERYVQGKAAETAKEKAEDILSRLRGGADMAKLAREEGLKMSETGLFLPTPEIPRIGYSPDMEGTLFEISGTQPYPGRVFFVDGSYIVIRFKEEG